MQCTVFYPADIDMMHEGLLLVLSGGVMMRMRIMKCV